MPGRPAPDEGLPALPAASAGEHGAHPTGGSGPLRLTSPMLKAMAHPLRRRILELMHDDVPRRAADLAEIVGAPANSVSFHLRQLAKAGLIVEAPEHARDRRDRVWVAAGHGYTVPTPDSPVGPEDELVLRSFLDQEALDLHRLVSRVTSWVPDWSSGREQRARAMIQTGLLELTHEDLTWLSEALAALMDEAIERSRRPSDEPRGLWRMVAILADDSLPDPPTADATRPDPQEQHRDG